mmetsp:Transcript_14575/g.43517  ORF Transcript_14575/g.43517 Transcript_14575/m.43517 type:complete len:89 (-) Transcript_14575:549-815(-)
MPTTEALILGGLLTGAAWCCVVCLCVWRGHYGADGQYRGYGMIHQRRHPTPPNGEDADELELNRAIARIDATLNGEDEDDDTPMLTHV